MNVALTGDELQRRPSSRTQFGEKVGHRTRSPLMAMQHRIVQYARCERAARRPDARNCGLPST